MYVLHRVQCGNNFGADKFYKYIQVSVRLQLRKEKRFVNLAEIDKIGDSKGMQKFALLYV